MKMARLLIVEDDANDRELIEYALRGKFILRFANTLSEGCDEMVKDEPDAVLLDMRLPDSQDEDHALRAIKALRKKAAIIIVSGNFTPERAKAWIRGTASGCMSKDHMENRIVHEIVNGVNNHRGCKCLDETTAMLLK